MEGRIDGGVNGWTGLEGEVISFLSFLLSHLSPAWRGGTSSWLQAGPLSLAPPSPLCHCCVGCCVGIPSAWSWAGVIQEQVKEAGSA